MNSKVSVIVPVYNASAFIADTITSVLKQDHTDIELLLVDDGSADESMEVMKGFSSEKVRILTNTEKKRCGRSKEYRHQSRNRKIYSVHRCRRSVAWQ